eukprot:8959060-Pyramimonas_sp.AAC.1
MARATMGWLAALLLRMMGDATALSALPYLRELGVQLVGLQECQFLRCGTSNEAGFHYRCSSGVKLDSGSTEGKAG